MIHRSGLGARGGLGRPDRVRVKCRVSGLATGGTSITNTTVYVDRAQFAASESRIVTDMSADLLRLMSLVGLLIPLAVISLGPFTSTLARLRDYAVLKALGARTTRLAGTVVSQVAGTVTLALGAATGLAVALAAALPTIAPLVAVKVTPVSVGRVGLAALGASHTRRAASAAAHGRDLARLLRALADEDLRAVVIVSHDDRLREVAGRVLWLEDGAFREISALALDPVCGMAVEPTGPHLEWEGAHPAVLR